LQDLNFETAEVLLLMPDFAIVALGNSDLQVLVETVLSDINLTPLVTHEVDRILRLITERPVRLLVLSLSLFQYHPDALRYLQHYCPENSVLLIADSPLQAHRAHVTFGGCTHHVFFYPPSPLEIREFALTALRKQASKKGIPFETEKPENG